ncbi:MAG: hypothetical protein N2515_01545 [Deltaproteobacteria bacterium]|nr:hypothetical protein [Deltaproteobacteria bacterium]
MTREMLEAILGAAPGCKVEEAKGEMQSYVVAPDYQLTFYLRCDKGIPVISEVVRIECGSFLRIEQADQTLFFIPYDAVQAISVRHNKKLSSKTGF